MDQNTAIQLVKAIAGSAGKAFKNVKGSGVTVVKDNSDGVQFALDLIVKKDVLVGIPASAAPRKDGESLNNAARLYIHEFGAPEANIPARPTVMPGIEAAQSKITAYLGEAGRKAFEGQAGVDQALHKAGAVARDSIKRQINSNTPPPLASRTIADRLARGKKSTRTLVDTGEMRKSVTYVIRQKRK